MQNTCSLNLMVNFFIHESNFPLIDVSSSSHFRLLFIIDTERGKFGQVDESSSVLNYLIVFATFLMDLHPIFLCVQFFSGNFQYLLTSTVGKNARVDFTTYATHQK